MPFTYLDEATSSSLIDHGMAYEAIRDALIAVASGEALSFPVVAAHGRDRANCINVKAGTAPYASGLKIGSFWPGNAALGWSRHNSAILLINENDGRVCALLEAGRVNAYRTAAADALAVNALAKSDAATLAIFGAGHQAWYEIEAVRRVRPICRVLVVARDPGQGEAFAARVARQGVEDGTRVAASASGTEYAVRAADVIITATPARAPLFDDAWVRPGTHVSCIGADAIGKQEVPPALLRRAHLFCDLPSQSVVIGECQHIAQDVVAETCELIPLGSVLAGVHPGRTTPDSITLFDSSGLAAQDLAIGVALLRRWQETGAGQGAHR